MLVRGLFRNNQGRFLCSVVQPLQVEDSCVLDKVSSILWEWEECRSPGELKSLNLDLRPRFVTSVLQKATSDAALVYRFFRWAQQQPNFQHEPGGYQTMLQLLVDSKRYEDVHLLLEDVLDKCNNVSANLVNSFVHAYMAAGSVDKAFDAFARFAKMLKPNITMCNSFLEALIKREDFERANKLLQEMMLHGCYPDDGTFRLLMASKTPRKSFGLFKGILELERFPSFGLNRPVMAFICRATNSEEVCSVCEMMTKGSFYQNVVVCNSVLNAFRLAAKCNDAYKFFQTVKEKGCNPDDATYRILVLAHCEAGKTELAAKLFKKMQSIATLDVRTCNIVAHHLCKAGHVDDAAELVHCMMETGPHPDRVTWNSLLDGLFKVEKVDHAMKLFNKMSLSFFTADAYTYSILLHGLCKAGRIEEACGHLSQALRNGNVRHHQLYDALIGGLCKSGRYDHAMAVFRKLKMPNLVAFNMMIGACVKRGDLAAAVELFQEMKSKNRMPNVYTYNTLIQAMCLTSRVDDALKLLEEMISMRCSPNGLTFGCLVDGLCKANRVLQADKLLEVMDSVGCPPDVVVLTTLISGHFKQGGVENAWRMFQRIESSQECSPNLMTYNIMIDGLCKAHRVEEADRLLRKMQQSEVSPDEFTFNTLIDGHFKVGDCQGASSLYREMVRSGCSRSSITYNTLASGYCKAGEVDNALRVVQSPTAACHATVFMYNVVIGKLVKLGRLDTARQLFQEMAKRGCSPDAVTFSTLIGELCRLHLVVEAVDLLKKMTAAAISTILPFNMVLNAMCKSGDMSEAEKLYSCIKDKADVVTYNTLIDGYYKAGRARDGIVVFNDMLQHGCLPDTVSYNCLLGCLCSDGRIKEACNKVEEMRQRRCQPDVVTYNMLIGQCCKEERVEDACRLVAEALAAGIGHIPKMYTSLYNTNE